MARRTILTREFLAELPLHDPEESFLMVVERGEDVLADALNDARNNDDQGQPYWEMQCNFVNVVIATARRLDISPFAEMDVPTLKQFTSEQYDQFKSDLDHYVTQTMLDHAIRTRRDAIQIAPKLKDQLRTYVAGLKSVIDKAELSESKRSRLHAKLREFEEAIEKERVPIFGIIRIMVEVMSLSANVLAFADSQSFHKLVANVLEVVGEAKAEDDSNRPQPPHELPKMALPPRQITYKPTGGFQSRGPKQKFPDDLDDEIPF